MMRKNVNVIIASVTVIIVSFVFSYAYNKNRAFEVISVTGLGKQDFVSDLIVWKGSFNHFDTDLKKAYSLLDEDRRVIQDHLLTNGIDKKDIIFSSVAIEKVFKTGTDDLGRVQVTSALEGYKLSQEVTIESANVDKTEEVSRNVTELINKGIEFYSEQPEYFYTKLSALKVEMVAAATEDAHLRAQQVAKKSGSGLGKLKYANMGVFQITAQNSSEDFSWGGSYNTKSKRKTASITMKLQYEID